MIDSNADMALIERSQALGQELCSSLKAGDVAKAFDLISNQETNVNYIHKSIQGIMSALTHLVCNDEADKLSLDQKRKILLCIMKRKDLEVNCSIEINKECNNALKIAILAKHHKYYKENIKSLLSHQNININQVDHDNRTALYFAVGLRRIDAINLLINHENIDMSITPEPKKIPSHLFLNMLSAPAKNGATLPANQYEVSVLLLEKYDKIKATKNYIEQTDHNGRSALIIAVLTRQSLETFKLILEKSESVINHCDDHNYRALDYALVRGLTHIINELINHNNIVLNIYDVIAISSLKKDALFERVADAFFYNQLKSDTFTISLIECLMFTIHHAFNRTSLSKKLILPIWKFKLSSLYKYMSELVTSLKKNWQDFYNNYLNVLTIKTSDEGLSTQGRHHDNFASGACVHKEVRDTTSERSSEIKPCCD